MNNITQDTVTILDADRIADVFQRQAAHVSTLRKEPLRQRIARLEKMKQWITQNKAGIQQAVYLDFKKPAFEADLSETYVVLADINLAISNLKKWARPKRVSSGLTYLGTVSHIHYEPKGVCLIIAPWNYPFNLALGPLVSALAAGNAVILKPSELTPHTSRLIAKMVATMFEPEEVAVIEGGASVAEKLLQLPFDHLFFTGSTRVGKIVMSAAAKHLSSVTLELGGKSPVIVDKTADLIDAAEKIAWGKLINCGQTCVSPDYLFVHQEVKDPFLSLLKSQMAELFATSDGSFKSSANYARIINKGHFDRLSEAISQAIASGAGVVCGGEADGSDNFISPTVLDNVPLDTVLMSDEIFGPILPVNSFSSHDDVIQFINSRPKALSLYLFSRDKKVQRRYMAETSSGTACVNDVVVQFQHPNLPFGGVGDSGMGKSHGYYGFLAFSNEKAWLKQRIGLTSPKLLFPPYTSFKRRFLDLLMKYF